MSKLLRAAVSSDIDTLASIYKGAGCRRSSGYTYAELKMGLENFSRFLKPYNIKATLFMVGNDFLHEHNHSIIRAMADEGHEVANHTMTHAQGFRFLSKAEKESEIAGMEKVCEKVIGQRPVGFRSPGWNISDNALGVLLKRGYLYDSSVHPTFLMPVLKFMHWQTMRNRQRLDRTTMGQFRYMFACPFPYRTGSSGFVTRGNNGIVEFPITVTPVLRLSFFATTVLAFGRGFLKRSLKRLRERGHPLQFQFHLSDFVDYTHPDISDQVPRKTDGVYIPQSLLTPLLKKLEIFKEVLELLAKYYSFSTLRQMYDDTFQDTQAE